MDSKTCLKAASAQAFSLDSEQCDELVSRGEYKLLQGDISEALDAFKTAEKQMTEPSGSLYYRMGLALFEYGSEDSREQALLLATKKFKLAHSFDPSSSDILHAWGNALCHLGEKLGEHHYFISSKEKYEKALGLGESSPELLWDYGNIWYHIGTRSEEAFDLQKGLQAFEQASLEAEALPSEFWVDYGATALLVSTKVNDTRQIVKAVNCFKHAVSEEESSFEGWSCLAEALQTLYEHTHDEDHFAQANDCFDKASILSPQDAEHWLDWAQFLLSAARRTNDVKRLRSCLEKCHHAYAYENDNALALAIWAEALARLGHLTERLDLIYEAENKISEALEINDEDPEIWFSLGMCYTSLGHYFNDFDYFYQAIEKFQIGLSIDRTCGHIWQAMANTYVIVGALEEDVEVLLQSLKFYEKALSISSTSTLHIDYAKALSKIGELNHEQKWLEHSINHFEAALSLQRNAIYLHPEWLFSYASTLDFLGEFHEEDKYYTRAIEIFSHVLMVDPDFPHVHHRLAQVFCHLGELIGEIDYFYRAIHHMRLSLKHDEDNDQVILDWGISLINIGQHTPTLTDVDQLMHDAEQKITLAAKLGNVQAYYYLSCLYSLKNCYEQSLYFLMKANHYNAIPPNEELLNDEWLEGLRCTSSFQEFLEAHPHLQEGST